MQKEKQNVKNLRKNNLDTTGTATATVTFSDVYEEDPYKNILPTSSAYRQEEPTFADQRSPSMKPADFVGNVLFSESNSRGRRDVDNSDWVEIYSEKYQRVCWQNKRNGKYLWENPFTMKYSSSFSSPRKAAAVGGGGGGRNRTIVADKAPVKVEVDVDGEESNAASSITDVNIDVPIVVEEDKAISNNNNVSTRFLDKIAQKRKDAGKDDRRGHVEWVEKYSDIHQRTYWQNPVNGSYSWVSPTRLSKIGSDQMGEKVWEESFSSKHKKKFWRNKKTSEISWTDPMLGNNMDEWFNIS